MKPLIALAYLLPSALYLLPSASIAVTPEQAMNQYESSLQQELWEPTQPAGPATAPPTARPTVQPARAQQQQFIQPTTGTLTSGYGWRWGKLHKGIDIAANVGTPIVAAAGGTVSSSGWNSGGYGNLVEIRHSDGTVTRYGHNSKLLVTTSQEVKQGQAIALMGSTGYSTGSHCHFEIILPGKGAVNPTVFLAAR